jgi:hypothetical protein
MGGTTFPSTIRRDNLTNSGCQPTTRVRLRILNGLSEPASTMPPTCCDQNTVGLNHPRVRTKPSRRSVTLILAFEFDAGGNERLNHSLAKIAMLTAASLGRLPTSKSCSAPRGGTWTDFCTSFSGAFNVNMNMIYWLLRRANDGRRDEIKLVARVTR